MIYKNTKTGREIERPALDTWLEASPGWERVQDEPLTGPIEEEDTHGGS